MIKKIVGLIVMVALVTSILLPITSSESSGQGPLNVVVIAGQSNGAYMETTTVSGVTNVICDPNEVNGEVDLPTENAYYYGTSSRPILYGSYYENPSYDTTLDSYDIYPMVSEDSWVIGGEEAAIASELTAKSNCPVLIINVCAPGAPIDWFEPSATGGQYAEDVIEDALSKVEGYTINKTGFVWIQGESNKTTAIDTYISEFEVINEWYESIGFDKAYMVQTKPANSGNAATAQLRICNLYSNVTLASTAPSTFTTDNGLLVSDNLHYSQEGRNILGEDIGEAIYVEVYTDLVDPNILSIIPIVVLAGIAIGAVGLFISRRD